MPIDLLVHNVGHHDVYPILRGPDGPCLGHMAGFYVQPLLARLGQHLAGSPAQVAGDRLVFSTPLTLDFSAKHLAQRLQLRESEVERLGQPVLVDGVLLPLLGPVVRDWVAATGPGRDRRLLLVTSAPSDPAASSTGTRGARAVLAPLALAIDPLLVVTELVNQETPFHFDPRADFVRQELLPWILAAQGEAVARSPKTWRQEFSLTLSLSTGTTPVIASILAATREFHPALLHVPRARQVPALEDSAFEVERHVAATVRQRPAAPVAEEGEDVQRLVQDLREWAAAAGWTRQRLPEPSELETFWLRKSGKPVLAALLVSTPEGPRIHRGMNLEVSLPTGTLCAERNAIGSALAANPRLGRRDFRAIAVWAPPLWVKKEDPASPGASPASPESPALVLQDRNPLLPCGACREWLQQIAEVNPELLVITFPAGTFDQVIVQRVASLDG